MLADQDDISIETDLYCKELLGEEYSITTDESVTYQKDGTAINIISRLYDFQPSAKALKRCGLSDPAAALTVEYLDSEEERQTVTLLLG